MMAHSAISILCESVYCRLLFEFIRFVEKSSDISYLSFESNFGKARKKFKSSHEHNTPVPDEGLRRTLSSTKGLYGAFTQIKCLE